MTRHPDDTELDPPGGRAAERLREFIEQRYPDGIPFSPLPEDIPEEEADLDAGAEQDTADAGNDAEQGAADIGDDAEQDTKQGEADVGDDL